MSAAGWLKTERECSGAWPSGVGGAQCEECYRTTIVRGFEPDFMGEPTIYLCRECASGCLEDEQE